jgi:hypothetical protein
LQFLPITSSLTLKSIDRGYRDGFSAAEAGLDSVAIK